eukprot:s92_g54.t1
MAHMTRDAPPGFRGPDMAAIIRADRELWMRAFGKCKPDLKVDTKGQYPLDVALLSLYTSPEVVFHLLPTLGNAQRKRSRSKTPPKPKKTQPEPSAPSDTKNKPDKTNRRQQNRVMVPKNLKGFSGVNPKKMRICYSYNLPHGCSNTIHTKDGYTRCVKGVHQCIKLIVRARQRLSLKGGAEHLTYSKAIGSAVCVEAKRKKDTAIWTSIEQLPVHLERKCDDSHEQLAWGKADTPNGLATAAECAYNEHMCASWAQAIADFAFTRGFCPPPQHYIQDAGHDVSNQQVNKAILGCLPRGRKVPPLLTDWLEPQLMISAWPEVQALPFGKRIPDAVTIFPAGSKLVRFTNEMGVEPSPECRGEMPKFAMVGIPREPLKFVGLACSLVHPVLRAMQVGDAMKDAIHAYEDGDKPEFRRIQCRFSQKLVHASLKDEEDSLHVELPEHLQCVLKTKRLRIFRKLLDDIQYTDAKIAGEMVQGFPLCGWLPMSGVFPAQLRPPDLHVDTLQRMSASFTARTLTATKSSGDSEMDEMLWKATLDEVAAGFLSGPCDADQCPKDAIASPRFGLMQKGNLRPIENFSASHVNSATGMQDKLQVDTVDEICAMIKAWAQQSFGATKLVGRSYGLKKAYRQIGISKDHLKFGWISVWCPEAGCPKLFRI